MTNSQAPTSLAEIGAWTGILDSPVQFRPVRQVGPAPLDRLDAVARQLRSNVIRCADGMGRLIGADRTCLPVRVQRSAATTLRAGHDAGVGRRVRTSGGRLDSKARNAGRRLYWQHSKERRTSSDCGGRAVLKRRPNGSNDGAVQCPCEFTAQNKLEALHTVVQVRFHDRLPENLRCDRAIRRAKLQPDRHRRPNQYRC